MGSKKKKAEATTEAVTETTTTTETATATETVPEPAPEQASEEPPKKKAGKKKTKVASDGTATLADVAAGYLAHMEASGKSDGTISSYRMELKTAAAELGEDTKVADLTPERVQEFFDSKRVTKLRSGRVKAKPSIDKTRRVLRLALVWAAERHIIERAPIPETVEAKA